MILNFFSGIKSVTDCGKLQADLDKLMIWSLEWKLSFNTSKCHIMHLGKNNNGKHNYTMGVSQIQPLSEANSMVGLIKRTFTNVNTSDFTTLYKTMLRPIMEYASCI